MSIRLLSRMGVSDASAVFTRSGCSSLNAVTSDYPFSN